MPSSLSGTCILRGTTFCSDYDETGGLDAFYSFEIFSFSHSITILTIELEQRTVSHHIWLVALHVRRRRRLTSEGKSHIFDCLPLVADEAS